MSSKYWGFSSCSASVEVGTKLLGLYSTYWGFQSSIGSEGLKNKVNSSKTINDIPKYCGSRPIGRVVGGFCLRKYIPEKETTGNVEPWGKYGPDQSPHVTGQSPSCPSSPRKDLHGRLSWSQSWLISHFGAIFATATAPSRHRWYLCMQPHRQTLSKPQKKNFC